MLWSDVNHGDVVWLLGKKDGEPHAYGPFIVRSSANRMLENRKRGHFTTHFKHIPEELLVKEIE